MDLRATLEVPEALQVEQNLLWSRDCAKAQPTTMLWCMLQHFSGHPMTQELHVGSFSVKKK